MYHLCSTNMNSSRNNYLQLKMVLEKVLKELICGRQWFPSFCCLWFHLPWVSKWAFCPFLNQRLVGLDTTYKYWKYNTHHENFKNGSRQWQPGRVHVTLMTAKAKLQQGKLAVAGSTAGSTTHLIWLANKPHNAINLVVNLFFHYTYCIILFVCVYVCMF